MRICYNMLRCRLMFETWTFINNESNFLVAFELFLRTISELMGNFSYYINKEPWNTPLKTWIKGNLWMKIRRENKMGLKVHLNPKDLDLRNRYGIYARGIRLKVETSRMNYYSRQWIWDQSSAKLDQLRPLYYIILLT